MLCMVVGIILLCIFPEIALWLPETLMGPSIQ
jgi:TRAP-type C4-dicarboxylate transport system permease large subunit